MANLTGPSTGGPNDTASTGGEGRDVFDMAALTNNVQAIERIRSFMGIICGCCAGILGLTNSAGIAFFLLSHIFVSASILTIKMKFDLKNFLRTPLFSFLLDGLQNCFMSYMLFWTLFYGLVFLF